MLSLFILLPLVCLIILNLPFKFKIYKAALFLTLLLSFGQAIMVLFHPGFFWNGADSLNRFFSMRLYADNFTYVMLLSIGIVVSASVLVAREMITEYKHRLNFINLILICMIGMNGTVLLTDIFSLYVFLEITAVSSFILIAFKRDLFALEGAFKYLILSGLATVLMLTGIGILFLYAGDTSFEAIKQTIQNNSSNGILISAIALFLCALFIKGGLVPFHGWLLPAYSAASAPVSVLLAGIVTKVAGISVLIRLITTVFAPMASINNILLAAGLISVLFGAIAALKQEDFKRLLAYSSISQVGYIILGLGCGSPIGIAGAVFHLFNHSIFKSLLFVNAAAVEQRVGSTNFNKLGGLGSKMPYSNASSLIATLSTAGIPPTAGFWSKLLIIIALWQGGNYSIAVIAILTSIVTLAYLLSIQRRVFFGILAAELKDIKEAGVWIVSASAALAAIILITGITFPFLFNTFLMPINNIFK
jgi:multicomponent Na+:H+ antiporter subunit D